MRAKTSLPTVVCPLGCSDTTVLAVQGNLAVIECWECLLGRVVRLPVGHPPGGHACSCEPQVQRPHRARHHGPAEANSAGTAQLGST